MNNPSYYATRVKAIMDYLKLRDPDNIGMCPKEVDRFHGWRIGTTHHIAHREHKEFFVFRPIDRAFVRRILK